MSLTAVVVLRVVLPVSVLSIIILAVAVLACCGCRRRRAQVLRQQVDRVQDVFQASQQSTLSDLSYPGVDPPPTHSQLQDFGPGAFLFDAEAPPYFEIAGTYNACPQPGSGIGDLPKNPPSYNSIFGERRHAVTLQSLAALNVSDNGAPPRGRRTLGEGQTSQTQTTGEYGELPEVLAVDIHSVAIVYQREIIREPELPEPEQASTSERMDSQIVSTATDLKRRTVEPVSQLPVSNSAAGTRHSEDSVVADAAPELMAAKTSADDALGDGGSEAPPSECHIIETDDLHQYITNQGDRTETFVNVRMAPTKKSKQNKRSLQNMAEVSSGSDANRKNNVKGTSQVMKVLCNETAETLQPSTSNLLREVHGSVNLGFDGD